MKLRRRASDVRLELTPLIDVVFLLLVFFVFALVLMVRADTLDLRLPEVGTGDPAERIEAIRVTLTADGDVLVEGQATEQGAVGESVHAALAARPGAPVVLSADERASAGALIELADTLVAAEVTEFSVLGNPRSADPDNAPPARTGPAQTGGAEAGEPNPLPPANE
jgi:biopolymer transport protein ExbD